MSALAARARAAKTWLFECALPLWAEKGFDARTGLFQEKLDARTAAPIDAPRRTRVQARQTYVFIEAGRLGWRGDWRTPAAGGIKTLCGPARTPAGAVGYTLDGNGALVEPRADLYEQAFALFAMAHGRTLDPLACDSRIAELLDYLDTQRAANGGFIERAPKPAPRWQNPHMHLLEAGLALKETDGDARGAGLAREMVELFDRHFFDSANGVLGEFYNDDWSPLEHASGPLAEPGHQTGHQCEWVWLLDLWRKNGGGDRSAQTELLWARAVRDGLWNGVAIDGIGRAGGAREKTARLWPQTEYLKAALVRYERGLGTEEEVCAAHDALLLYFEGLPPGLWRDKRREDGSFVEEPVTASSLYHIVLAYSELLRIAG